MKAALAALLIAAGTPAGAECRLALALGFDVSRSVSDRDYAIQRDGLLAALDAAPIRAALLNQRDHVAVAVYEWSNRRDQTLVVPWTEVRGEADLARLRAAVAGHDRVNLQLPTAVGAALIYAHDLFGEAPACAARTLDISGDGRNNDWLDPLRIYAREDFGDILVNGLAVGGHEADIVAYYRTHVIRGPGAFVEVARDQADFPRAVLRKLERELTQQLLGDAAPLPPRG